MCVYRSHTHGTGVQSHTRAYAGLLMLRLELLTALGLHALRYGVYTSISCKLLEFSNVIFILLLTLSIYILCYFHPQQLTLFSSV